MKKILLLVLVFIIFAIAGCSSNNQTKDTFNVETERELVTVEGTIVNLKIANGTRNIQLITLLGSDQNRYHLKITLTNEFANIFEEGQVIKATYSISRLYGVYEDEGSKELLQTILPVWAVTTEKKYEQNGSITFYEAEWLGVYLRDIVILSGSSGAPTP